MTLSSPKADPIAIRSRSDCDPNRIAAPAIASVSVSIAIASDASQGGGDLPESLIPGAPTVSSLGCPENCLEVGLTPDGREVVINHPDLQPDANGCGHIVFSPQQARWLAKLLMRKADECQQ